VAVTGLVASAVLLGCAGASARACAQATPAPQTASVPERLAGVRRMG
jgi:hypothetical protein